MVEPATPAAPPTTDDVAAAADRIRPFVRRTPLVELDIGGRRTLAKLEHMQLSGSFKVRGALNAALRARDTGARTVVAASGGNHGLGIAAAAELLGLEAHVFLGDDAPREKIDRVSRPGVELHLVDGSYDQAVAEALALADALGAPFVSPYEHPDVIAGQGTLTLEVVDERPDCDLVVVAVGGGGLLAGTLLASGGRHVVGVEPRGIPTVTSALAAGRPVDVAVESPLTESALGASRTGDLNFAIFEREAPLMAVVDDEPIRAAQRELWESFRLAVEPAAALPLAALELGVSGPAGDALAEAELPCLVLCGANSGWQIRS